MILEIRFENFRSMHQSTILDMSAESICEFKDSIMKWNRNKTDEYRIVPLKLLYGQSASGKTNILLGIKILQEIINAGRIDTTLSAPYEELVHIQGTNKPIALGITFIHNSKVFCYDVKFTKEKVVYESLYVNRSCLFERDTKKIELAKTNKAVEYLDEQRIPSLEMNERQSVNYRKQDLFLTMGFKCYIAPSLASEIQTYFEERLYVTLESDKALNHPIQIENPKEVTAFLKAMNIKEPLDGSCPLSKGTTKLVNLTDLFFTSIKEGKILVMDEMDTSMDPHILIQLLSRLHDPKINKNETQLLFNTFNPVYLNKYFVRRDEITFVSKTKDGTSLKTLIDYANRENNYMRKYLDGEYDTIAQIDYKKLFQR